MDKLIRREFRIEEEFLQNARRRILVIDQILQEEICKLIIPNPIIHP